MKKSQAHIIAKLNCCIWPLATASLILCHSHSSQAATANWDGNSAVGTVGDGVNWANANNWTSSGIIDAAPPNLSPGDDLTFGNGTVGTISLGGNRIANSLTFNAGFTLDAPASTNTLTLTTGSISVGPSVSATINPKIDGTAGLTLSGAGTLILTAANTYFGNTTIISATLEVNGASAIPAGQLNVDPKGSLLINAAATLQSDITNSGTIQIASGQTMKLASSGAILNQNAGQIIVGAGGILDTNNNEMTFNGGKITLDAGTAIQKQGEFKPSFMLLGGSAANPVTITSSTVGAGQLPGFVDLSEANQSVPTFGGGQMTISAPLTDGSFTAGGGVLTLSGNNTYQGASVTNGTITFAAADSVSASGGIQIHSGGIVQLATGIGSPTTTRLSIDRNGGLDIANNHLFINYGSGPDPISTIAAYIANGFNHGAWNGTSGGGADTFNGGIFSSTAAANSASYGIGYADSADPGNPAGLASGTIEIRYTLLGDANLDGKVNGTDFAILATNFNQAVTSWDQGDFDYDKKVNGSDFAFIASNINQGASGAADLSALDAFAAANGLTANVPEPVCVGFALMASFGMRVRQRHKSR